ncbi:DNA-binding GntR family transcriptional regulator [Sphaerotilus hippei]|uniref:DNA-binding GntR family transcriptional regulator n=1 Tax=Sphaerotilus hippei TaxID=744406 RepID=A0A318GWI6_9BURK|nr:GntR family transcriptional regulator [Sphaerotilus hippei]PXW93353.1 DNA-binding GntR family transcriptional regulator [Sphaerotilus hippei]
MPLPSTPIRLDRSRHAAPQVFEKLREMILTLELAPGTLLSRAELAAWFGISQTPVRDALIKLGEEGLVDIFPQHATVVSRIGLAAARQAHFLRRAIELEAVLAAAALPGEARATLAARLGDVIHRQDQAMNAQDVNGFIESDRGFHRLLIEAAAVPDLGDLIHRRSGQVDRLRRLHLPAQGKMAAILIDHRRIVAAIAAGDGAAAQAALRQHLSGTLSQAEQIRSRHPDYVED